jgi:hypothetical protein
MGSLWGASSTIASRESKLTLTVITEAHLGLAETNGVLSSTDAIVLLELNLVDALWKVVWLVLDKKGGNPQGLAVGIRKRGTNLSGEVDLNGLDTNVLGTSSHGGGGVEGMGARSTKDRQSGTTKCRERKKKGGGLKMRRRREQKCACLKKRKRRALKEKGGCCVLGSTLYDQSPCTFFLAVGETSFQPEIGVDRVHAFNITSIMMI